MYMCVHIYVLDMYMSVGMYVYIPYVCIALHYTYSRSLVVVFPLVWVAECF